MREAPDNDTMLRWMKLGAMVYNPHFVPVCNIANGTPRTADMMGDVVKSVIATLEDDMPVTATILKLSYADEKVRAAIYTAMECWAVEAIGALVDGEVLIER